MPIFDQGYQHWHGELSGRPARWLTITGQGVRAHIKNRWVRLLLLFAWLPALTLVSFLIIWGLIEQRSSLVEPLRGLLEQIFRDNREIIVDPLQYRVVVWTLAYDYFFRIEMFFAMLLVLLVGMKLISQDLRFNAIPLYFARPLTRFDYFLGKLGVIGFFVGAVAVAPALIGYLLGVCFSMDLSIFAHTGRVLLAILVYGAIVVLSAGMLMLALSSLSRNARYVGVMWIAVWLVGNIVASILFDGVRLRWGPLVSYTGNLLRMADGLMDTPWAWQQVKLSGWPDLAYPWYWSAAVLTGLFGISVWILTSRVKSLDRLR
jgi:ABC-2 type transport system permease protein